MVFESGDYNMSTKKAIIFDLDGVIVHTDHFHFLAWKKLADRLGIEFDERINNRLRGVSRMDSLDILLEKSPTTYPLAEKTAFAAEKNELYRQFLSTMTPADVAMEVRSTLETLKAAGHLLAIGSSSKNAKMILAQVGLSHFFDAIADGNDIQHSKPAPDVFLAAARFLGEPPTHCIVVEDAVAGVLAGKAAGMETIAIGDAASAHTADHDIVHFADLLRYV